MFTIVRVASEADLDAARALFAAYAESLPVDLGYQDFATELASLPGKYAVPAGVLLLARDRSGAAIGCVGVRPLSAGVAEMKRLFVRAASRGLGLGRALMDAALVEAGRLGYREIRLDTLPTMTSAIAMYRAAGFEPIAPYYKGAPAGTLFLGRQVATVGVHLYTEWLEFHDSRVTSCAVTDGRAEVTLDAYVHRWRRDPDGWRGSGWIRPVRIVLEGAFGTPPLVLLPADISDGTVDVDAPQSEMVTVPFGAAGAIRLWLCLTTSDVIELRGTAIRIEPAGDATYVEELPDDARPTSLG